MTVKPLSNPASSGSYGSFRDAAITRRAHRRRLKRKGVVTALALAATVFSATTAASLLIPHAGTTTPQKSACVEAGQRLAPWFKAETERKAQVGLDERDDFNLLLTWFQNAQGQCASGQTGRAVENFQAVESMIAERIEQREPEPEDG